MKTIQWEKVTPAKNCQAVQDDINTGVLDKHGHPQNTEHFPFVDDTLLADIMPYLIWAMAASIEALFIIFG